MSGWTGPVQSTILKGPTGSQGPQGLTGAFFTTLSVRAATATITSPTSFVLGAGSTASVITNESLSLQTNGLYLQIGSIPLMGSSDELNIGLSSAGATYSLYARLTYVSGSTTQVQLYTNAGSAGSPFTYTTGSTLSFTLDGTNATLLLNGTTAVTIPYTFATAGSNPLFFFVNTVGLTNPATFPQVLFYPTSLLGSTGATGATGAASTVTGPTGPTGASSTVPGPTGPDMSYSVWIYDDDYTTGNPAPGVFFENKVGSDITLTISPNAIAGAGQQWLNVLSSLVTSVGAYIALTQDSLVQIIRVTSVTLASPNIVIGVILSDATFSATPAAVTFSYITNYGYTGPTGPTGSTGTFAPIGTGGTGYAMFQNPDNSLFYTNSSLQIAVSSGTQQIQASADFVPSAHLTYNLGQSGMAWNSAYIGPGSLHIGGATISATGANLVLQGNLQPTSSNTQTLGSTGLPWKEIFMGPGSLNIAGPSGANATLGSDQNGIAYTQKGFATPFINIGPSISAIDDPGAIGGWVLGPTGTLGAPGYDLIAQQKLPGASVPAGLTGPVFSLIQPRDPMNVSTISTSVLSVTSTATFSYPPISATNPSTSNQLANKAYVDSVKNQYSLGNLLVVDAVNGNDTTATPSGTPYSTITKAVLDLQAGDSLWVLPGTYNITSSILLPANTSIRGHNVTTSKIQMLNAGTQSTMITMNTNTRVEDLGLTMTAVSGNSNVTMFYFPGQTCQTAKLKGLSCTLDTTNQTPGSGNVTAIYCDGSNTQIPGTFAWNAAISCSFNVYSQNTNQVNGVLLSNSPILTLRETNINVSSTTVGCGIQTTGTSVCLARSCAIQGGGNDLKQVGGTIQLGSGTDLINRTVGGYPFTTFQTPLEVFYGVIGDLFKNRGVASGWIWPGSVNAQQADPGKHVPVYPDELPSYYTVLQSTIVYGFQTTLRGSPGTGASTIIQLYKNDVVVPSYIIGYGFNESTIKTNYASTFTIGVTDKLSWFISSSVAANSNDSHDLTMNLKLY